MDTFTISKYRLLPLKTWLNDYSKNNNSLHNLYKLLFILSVDNYEIKED